MFDDQRVDVLLGHRGAKALFARVHHHRLAAGQFQDFGADQPVVDHHVCLVQRAAGFQRQQFRITRASADKGDVTIAGGAGQMAVQQVIKGGAHGVLARSNRTRARGEVIVAPEITTRAAKGQGVGGPAKRLADARQRAQRSGQALLKVGLDRARQHGRGPFGADGHGDGIAVDDGGGDEFAVVQVVDDVDQRAVGLGDGGGAGILDLVLVGGVEQRRTGGVTVAQGAVDQCQLALGGPCLDLRICIRCKDSDRSLGFHQQAQLGQSSLATARKDDAAACGGQKDRKMVHGAAIPCFVDLTSYIGNIPPIAPYTRADKDIRSMPQCR